MNKVGTKRPLEELFAIRPSGLATLGQTTNSNASITESPSPSHEPPNEPMVTPNHSRRFENETVAQRARERIEVHLARKPELDESRKPGDQADTTAKVTNSTVGGLFDDAGRREAHLANTFIEAPPKESVYAQEKAAVAADLSALDLLKGGTDRIHIEDGLDNYDPTFTAAKAQPHAHAVARAAFGPGSLAESADKSLRYSANVESAFAKISSPEQKIRRQRHDDLAKRFLDNDLGLREITEFNAAQQEAIVVNKAAIVGDVSSSVPNDGKKTFVNLSWGTSPQRSIDQSAERIAVAPKGTAAHQAATDILGRSPKVRRLGSMVAADEQDVAKIRDGLWKRLDPKLKTPEHQSNMTEAKSTLERELHKGRSRAVLVFSAGGNDFKAARREGRPQAAEVASSGTEGLIAVGYYDQKGLGHADDTVADGSSGFGVTVVGSGVNIPVADQPRMPGTPPPQDPQPPALTGGSSIASPSSGVQTAYAMATANPKLSVDEIASLLTDPRALRNLPGSRDGHGAIDEFAAVVLAANPTLSRADITEARAMLHEDSSEAGRDVARKRLGLNAD